MNDFLTFITGRECILPTRMLADSESQITLKHDCANRERILFQSNLQEKHHTTCRPPFLNNFEVKPCRL